MYRRPEEDNNERYSEDTKQLFNKFYKELQEQSKILEYSISNKVSIEDLKNSLENFYDTYRSYPTSFIKNIDFDKYDNNLIKEAINKNYYEAIQLLIKKTDINHEFDALEYVIITTKDTEMYKLLLETEEFNDYLTEKLLQDMIQEDTVEIYKISKEYCIENDIDDIEFYYTSIVNDNVNTISLEMYKAMTENLGREASHEEHLSRFIDEDRLDIAKYIIETYADKEFTKEYFEHCYEDDQKCIDVYY